MFCVVPGKTEVLRCLRLERTDKLGWSETLICLLVVLPGSLDLDSSSWTEPTVAEFDFHHKTNLTRYEHSLDIQGHFIVSIDTLAFSAD